MDAISEKVILVSTLDEKVEFDSKIANLSELVANMPDKNSPLSTGLSTQLLNFVKTFAEKHEYDQSSI